ncbi:MAG TPA: porin family protein [Gammaproteobacteria bacterium]|nr:porin family protein [Gammaproteobacteria bacterium]
MQTVAEDLQDQFSTALQAIEEDRLRTARELLDAILTGNPSMHRARLELARAYFLSLDYVAAREQAQQVLDDPNTPPSVRTTVLAFMAQIDADEKQLAVRHTWTPSIYLGLMHDSNVNVGPNQDVIQIGGTPFAVTRKQADLAFVVNPGLAHTYNPGKRFQAGEHTGYFLWQSSASVYYRGYFDETDFNLSLLTLRTGPAWVVPRHWRAAIGLQADQIWLGDGRLALFSSLNPSIIWQIGDSTEFGLEGVLTRRDYNKDIDGEREGWYQWAGATLGQYFFDKKLAIKGGAGYFRFDTDDSAERFANEGPDLFLGGVVQAWENGSVIAKVGYRNYDFKGLEPGFPNPRDEDEWRYTLGFQHNFKSGALNNWALIGNWTHTENDSNVPIYDYSRDQISLGLSRKF